MSIRTRIILGILAVVALGFSLFVHRITSDLEVNVRKATEEPLVDASRALAAMAGTFYRNQTLDREALHAAFSEYARRPFYAPIFDFAKTNAEFRVLITDLAGMVVFDSEDRDEGKDFSRWNDIALTLQGKYGVRTSHEIKNGRDTGVMYVASPIRVNGMLTGVLSVGKPTDAANLFEQTARRRILWGGLLVCLAVILAGSLLSLMITRPLDRLAAYARAVGEGQRPALPRLGGSEVAKLGAAFEEMRVAVEGRRTVEKYVIALAHEMKGPISAIQGAAELLAEDMPKSHRERFLQNIRMEADRLRAICEKIMLLARLEQENALSAPEPVNLLSLCRDIAESCEPEAVAAELSLCVSGCEAVVSGDPYLLRQAIENLVQNALEFSPAKGSVCLTVTKTHDHCHVRVSDSGPGIPDYALPRVFERFFSLARPASGRKSSGLGLCLAQEGARLHGGEVIVENRPEGGATACLTLPCAGGPE